MELGAFSVSLAVKDIQASLAFYEKFGFEVFGGDHPSLAIKDHKPGAGGALVDRGCVLHVVLL